MRRRDVLVDVLRVREGMVAQARRVALAVLLVALLAQVRIPLPFTPVPVTGQTLAVLLVGAWLPPGEAGLSLALYALVGAAGLPVFSGLAAGLGHLLGPTGGYILGFIPAAWVVGYGLRRFPLPWRARVWVALLLGNLTIYALGLPWLAAFVGWERALQLGFLPFLLGDAFKLALAAAWVLARGPRRNP